MTQKQEKIIKYLGDSIRNLNTTIFYLHAFNDDSKADELEKAKKILDDIFNEL